MIDQYTTSDFIWEPWPVWRAMSIFIADNWFPVLAGIITLAIFYKLLKNSR